MNLTYNKGTPGIIIYACKWLFIEYVYYASGRPQAVWCMDVLMCVMLWLIPRNWSFWGENSHSHYCLHQDMSVCSESWALCLSEFIPQWRTKWCFSKIGCLISTGFTLYGDWKWTFWRVCWFVNQGKSISDSCRQTCRNISYITRVSFLWSGFLRMGVPHEHTSLAGKQIQLLEFIFQCNLSLGHSTFSLI